MSLKETKPCKKCGALLPLSAFDKRTASKDGLKYRCRKCCSEADKEYYAANSDEINERNAEWNEANPEKMRKYRAQWRAKQRKLPENPNINP